MSEVKTRILKVTPDVAQALISANTRNRTKREHYVNRLASAMSRGEWKTNGDTIRVSRSGVLLDGQHRLSAIVKSGVTLEMIVVDGLDDDVFDTIDRGFGRTTGDVMQLEGEKNANVLAAATVLLYKLEKVGDPFNGNGANAPTTIEQRDVLSKNPGLRESASWAAGARWCKKYAMASNTCFCHYLFHKKDRESAASFFEGLETGAGLDAGSPILALRSRLSESRTGKERIDKRYMVGLIFKAFKLHRDGASVKTLRIRTEGDSPERDTFVL